jgi:hypothetical protein
MSPNPTSDLNIKMADNRSATLHFNFLGQKNRETGKIYLKMQLM